MDMPVNVSTELLIMSENIIGVSNTLVMSLIVFKKLAKIQNSAQNTDVHLKDVTNLPKDALVTDVSIFFNPVNVWKSVHPQSLGIVCFTSALLNRLPRHSRKSVETKLIRLVFRSFVLFTNVQLAQTNAPMILADVSNVRRRAHLRLLLDFVRNPFS